jgi:hypothetical protein
VDLSKTWLDEKSRNANQSVLESIADSIGATAQSLKAPIQVDYLEIGDASFSRAPLCSRRVIPSIYGRAAKQKDFSDISQLVEFLRFDCTNLILRRRASTYTDISGALNTASRLLSGQKLDYSAIIVLSDLKEELRPHQVAQLLSLNGVHVLLAYRVLEEDRNDPSQMDKRVAIWRQALRHVGATVQDVDDIQIDAGQVKRLLGK